MPEHETCKGCQWNNYPLCNGTQEDDGKYMNIENLRVGFECGQKDISTLTSLSFKTKSVLEQKVIDLEARIAQLEGK